jgi:hypothetical protein
MAAQNRLYGHMIATFSIGGTSYLAVCENAEMTFEPDIKTAIALKDDWETPHNNRGKWSGRGTFFISTVNTSGEGGPGGTLWTQALGQVQQSGLGAAIVFKDNGTSGAGNSLTGNALISNLTQKVMDGPQTYDVTLMGQGALASAIA